MMVMFARDCVLSIFVRCWNVKRIIAVCICVLLWNASAEIISWKGMELGLEEVPKWFTQYVKKNDEAALRRKFDVDSDCLILSASAKDTYLEGARCTAILACQKKALNMHFGGKKSASMSAVASLSQITEYWIQTDDKKYTVYVFFSMPKSGKK